MLSYQTVEPHTLELLKRLMAEPLFAGMRLVGGTALALQYGHRQSVDLDLFGRLPDDIFLLQHYTLRELMTFYRRKNPEHNEFRALMSLSYFEDAEEQLMPRMFSTLTWETSRPRYCAKCNMFEDSA